MTADDRYDVSGLPEAQFEPGSNGLVLKNLLGQATVPGTVLIHSVERRFFAQGFVLAAGCRKGEGKRETSREWCARQDLNL